MFFYKIDAQIINVDDTAVQDETDNYAKSIQAKLLTFYQNASDGTIFISSICGNRLALGAIAKDTSWLEENMENFLATAELDCRDIQSEEITLGSLTSLLIMSKCDNYIYDHEELTESFGIDKLVARSRLLFTEHMIQELPIKQKLIRTAHDLLCTETLIPELERIYQPPADDAAGHPVHYMVESENKKIRDSIYRILISALYANGRLNNRRFSVVKVNEDNCYESELNALYEACTGGAVVVKLGEKNYGKVDQEARLLHAIFGRGDNDDLSMMSNWFDVVCQTALRYYDKTLTVFCMPRSSEKVMASMREQLGHMTLVELTEDPLTESRSRMFLRQTARDHGVPAEKSLYKMLASGQKSFTTSELLRAFDVWYSRRLKTRSYPQYAGFNSSSLVSAESLYSGDAFTELSHLIGLGEAKSVIKQAVDYFKAQKLFRDRGFTSNSPTMHMAFTGSPGTAKTTVARLFARIMRENNLLSEGNLYEVSRADLIGKYVGWTARIVEDKFTEAMGSVLFIDEAYSLLDDKEGMYGDEAISTIVAQMENFRDDIVVIFAGYTDKMDEFLKRNPGLRSRIAFHVSFADYSPEELLQILEYIAGEQKMTLDDGVSGKVLPILSAASREPDFGNGRYVRNLFEKARMKQAGRLLSMDIDSLTSAQVAQLTADDFEAPPPVREVRQRIGFYVA